MEAGCGARRGEAEAVEGKALAEAQRRARARGEGVPPMGETERREKNMEEFSARSAREEREELKRCRAGDGALVRCGAGVLGRWDARVVRW